MQDRNSNKKLQVNVSFIFLLSIGKTYIRQVLVHIVCSVFYVPVFLIPVMNYFIIIL